MASPFSKPDPKEIIKEAFGEDAEEIKAKLAKLEAIEQGIGSVKDAQATQLTGLQEVRELIQRISENTDRRTQSEVQNPNNPNNELPKWDEDAEGAFKARISPLVMAQLETQASIAKRNVMDEIGRKHNDWFMFAEEIEKLVEKEPLQARAREQFWRNAYKVVKGDHMDDIIRDTNAKSGKFFNERSTSVVIIKEEEKKPEDSLTDDEKRVAASMGLDPAKYAEQKVKMNIWRS